MTRTGEAALLLAAATLAAMGVALVNLAGTGGIDARVGLTFFAFVIAFGAFELDALRVCRLAPRLAEHPIPSKPVLHLFRLFPSRRVFTRSAHTSRRRYGLGGTGGG